MESKYENVKLLNLQPLNTNMQIKNYVNMKKNISTMKSFVDFSNQEKEIDESFKDLDLKIAIIKEKAFSIMKNIKTSK